MLCSLPLQGLDGPPGDKGDDGEAGQPVSPLCSLCLLKNEEWHFNFKMVDFHSLNQGFTWTDWRVWPLWATRKESE